jgi:hypothetical protein
VKLPAGVTPERALALAGVAGLMAVAIAILVMISNIGSGDPPKATLGALATPVPTATPKPTPTPTPTPVPLTPEQLAARTAAAQIVTSRGYSVVRLRDYDPRRTLRVLIGRDAGGSRLAFFFVDDRYIGNDATEPSGKLKVKSQKITKVTLTYGVYAPGDQPCCPSGSPVDVVFRWDGTQLSPQDALPQSQLRRRPPAVQQ